MFACKALDILCKCYVSKEDWAFLQAYLEVVKHYVHDSLFSSYIHKVQPDCNHLWVFKKQLCISLALSGEASLHTSNSPHLTYCLSLTRWEP